MNEWIPIFPTEKYNRLADMRKIQAKNSKLILIALYLNSNSPWNKYLYFKFSPFKQKY